MKRIEPELLETLETLTTKGDWPEVEVYHKTGRSRTVRWTPRSEVGWYRQEEGWAVRAGDSRRSFFYAATGAPDPGTAWPEADGLGLRLPSARPLPRWTPPPDLDALLLGENEAHRLFSQLAEDLSEELPGARLVLGELTDGSSESQLASSREVESTVRRRAAWLYLEAAGPTAGAPSIAVRLAEREAGRFNVPALARRLADRLLVADRGEAPVRDRGEILLAPFVMVSLLDALSPLWLGPSSRRLAADLTDRRGRIASQHFTLIDDGRLPGGVLEAPADGEGQPTREVLVVEEGIFRQPILAWWQAPSGTSAVSGCCRRPSWRDLPRPGPTHLYLRPGDPPAASFVGNLSRGYYLLDVEGPPRVDADCERFAVPVCGFGIESGRPTAPLSGAWLGGTVSTLLNGLVAVARDLTFYPVGTGMVGAPSTLVKGLELRRRP